MKKTILFMGLIALSFCAIAQYIPATPVRGNLNVFKNLWVDDTVRATSAFIDTITTNSINIHSVVVSNAYIDSLFVLRNVATATTDTILILENDTIKKRIGAAGPTGPTGAKGVTGATGATGTFSTTTCYDSLCAVKLKATNLLSVTGAISQSGGSVSFSGGSITMDGSVSAVQNVNVGGVFSNSVSDSTYKINSTHYLWQVNHSKINIISNEADSIYLDSIASAPIGTEIEIRGTSDTRYVVIQSTKNIYLDGDVDYALKNRYIIRLTTYNGVIWEENGARISNTHTP